MDVDLGAPSALKLSILWMLTLAPPSALKFGFLDFSIFRTLGLGGRQDQPEVPFQKGSLYARARARAGMPEGSATPECQTTRCQMGAGSPSTTQLGRGGGQKATDSTIPLIARSVSKFGHFIHNLTVFVKERTRAELIGSKFNKEMIQLI